MFCKARWRQTSSTTFTITIPTTTTTTITTTNTTVLLTQQQKLLLVEGAQLVFKTDLCRFIFLVFSKLGTFVQNVFGQSSNCQ